MKFSQVSAWRIPSGSAQRVRQKHSGNLLWENDAIRFRYVSLGDSIAVGHAINTDWEANYGYQTQYGENGNTQTVIVSDSYTDLIHKDLIEQYGGLAAATSFAHSGDMVSDLMVKLNHTTVRDAIAKANIVTVCIGANDVLQPALMNFDQYVNSGDLSGITAIVQANLAKLANDNDANSYKALFEKLVAINPNAKYVFTTIYNPYKYLWLEESTKAQNYKDGFFGPLMWAVPDSLGDSMANSIRGAFFNDDYVKLVIDRCNRIGDWAEAQVTALNNVLRSKIAAYGNANILLADTKAVYDYVPDRPVSAPKHYNDLVNVEPTRGYVIQDLDWSQFWGNVDWAGGIDYAAIMENILYNVILPDIDPHPEEYGHYAMKCAFYDALGWTTLARHTVSYNANGGTGSMASQVVTAFDGMAAYVAMPDSAFGVPSSVYRFDGWNTAANGGGTAYVKGQVAAITGDTTLYAQWSGTCTVTVSHSIGDSLPTYGSGDTGPMECYALWIDGVEQSDLGAFSNGARTYTLPVGTPIGVIAAVSSGEGRSYITWNGNTVAGKSSNATYDFTLTSNINIHFEWNNWTDPSGFTSYWNCYITTS